MCVKYEMIPALLCSPLLFLDLETAQKASGKIACASRTEKVLRAKLQDVSLRRKKNHPEKQRQHKLTGWKDRNPDLTASNALKILFNLGKWVFRRYLVVVGLFSNFFYFSSSSFMQQMPPLRLLSGFPETILLPKQTKKLPW